MPLGLGIRFFELFLPVEGAERLTRIVFPLALHGALFAAIAGLSRKLCGPSAMAPAVLIAALTGGVFIQFEPGRIHHHAPQILLVVLILWASVAAIEAKKFWPAAGAAALAALSLSINIENLPYILVEIAAFALVFVAQGKEFRSALLGFGLSLAASSLLAFVLTVGPSRYFVGACDAFSSAHLYAIFFGAAAFVVLAALSGRLTSAPLRLAGCAFGGVFVLGAMALAYPACLHDPLAGVDPILRKLWLEKVEEARPLLAIVGEHPLKFLPLGLAALLGFAGALAAAWRERGVSRLQWLVVCAFIATGLAASMWQVRAISSASAVAIFGGAWLVARAIDWAATRGVLARFAAIALSLPFSIFWAILTPAEAEPSGASGRVTCRDPAALGALGALTPSLLLAPIDMGADILAETRHSVLAGPYHRNNHGNRQMVDAMMAEPDAAQKIVRDSGAGYVLFCPAMPELEIYAAAAPGGLAAQLLSGQPPDWLVPTPLAGSPYRIYSVR